MGEGSEIYKELSLGVLPELLRGPSAGRNDAQQGQQPRCPLCRPAGALLKVPSSQVPIAV